MTPEQRDHVILGPLKVWAGLLVLLGLTLGYAYLPHAPFKTAVSIAIAVAKALMIAMIFMQLRQSDWLVRLAALTGVVWVSFLYLIAFSDYFTR